MSTTSILQPTSLSRVQGFGAVLAATCLAALAYAMRTLWDLLPWYFSTSSVGRSVSNLLVYLAALALPAAAAGIGVWLLARRWRGALGAFVLVGGLWVVGQLACGIRCLLVFGLRLPDASLWPLYVPAAIAVVCATLWAWLVRSSEASS